MKPILFSLSLERLDLIISESLKRNAKTRIQEAKSLTSDQSFQLYTIIIHLIFAIDNLSSSPFIDYLHAD